MSRHKAFVPGTFVPGYRAHKNADGTLMLHTSGPDVGKQIITRATLVGALLHFANAAARKRVCAKIVCTLTDDKAILAGVQEHAKPRDLVRVGLYRGLSCRLANEIRADMRRSKRLKLAA